MTGNPPAQIPSEGMGVKRLLIIKKNLETRVRVRSTRTIRSDPKKDEKIVEENEEREIPGPSVSEEILTKDTFSKNPRQTAKSEPASPAPLTTSSVSKT